jgi:multiple sugar transport system permease protein
LKTLDKSLDNRFGKRFDKKIFIHIFIILLGYAMVHPLLWMLSSSFKPTNEIFSSKAFFPKVFTIKNYLIGWKGISGYTFTHFFTNSFFITFMCVLGNIISTSMAAYAFAKLEFRFKKILFAIMMGTLMLPYHVTLIPQYIIFNKLGWINSFLPIIVPKFLGVQAFFIFLLVQYMRTIPNEIIDSAKIDGCSVIGIYFRLIMPLSVPAIITTGILTFMWTWNDFFSQLLYLNKVSKFTVPVALKMFIDATSGSSWGAMFAMSILSITPLLLLFAFFQNYIVEGITSGSIKG